MFWGSVPEPHFPVSEFKYDFRPAQSSREGSSPSPSLLRRECSRLALKELFLQRYNPQMIEGERQPRGLSEMSPDVFFWLAFKQSLVQQPPCRRGLSPRMLWRRLAALLML